MEITILGSGTGTPSLSRGASGLMVKIANKNLLFDTGPGVIRSLLEIGVTYHDIDDIFYSHFHTDHTLDLASLLFAAKYALSLRTKELTISGPKGLAEFYRRLLDLYGEVISPEAYRINLREIGAQSLVTTEYKVVTEHLQHVPESLGYRIESNGRVVVYSGDTDVCENIVSLAQDADLLILECSFPDEMKVKGHLVPRQAAQIASNSNCRKLVLTHLYPVCQEDQILRQAKAAFKGEIVVAEDLMRFRL
ncbi:MAG: MBL fold metallo-hydrolase [Candidatus Omnitrophica bacterium]|nr:MBL fold metallo-hydrolase [Candidatus Omnitrophota bacterium]